VVHTDGWLGYEPLEKKGYRHKITAPSQNLWVKVPPVATNQRSDDDKNKHKRAPPKARLREDWSPSLG